MPNGNGYRCKSDANGQLTKVEKVGTIRKITINRYGIATGFRLTDGTAVKTQQRHSEHIFAHLSPADEVRIEGRWARTVLKRFALKG